MTSTGADPLARLLANNAQWAADTQEKDPEFFRKLSEGQQPKILWIGCADSRVPESVITNSKPGDIFVHRNVANQFHLDDDSALSVLTYAVEVLQVEHIVVVGHTHCGGAEACNKAAEPFAGDLAAAVSKPIVTVAHLPSTAPINVWLAPMTRLAVSLQSKASKLDQPPSDPVLQLVEANVLAQVNNIAKTESGQKVPVHGWVFQLENGKLRDLEITIKGT